MFMHNITDDNQQIVLSTINYLLYLCYLDEETSQYTELKKPELAEAAKEKATQIILKIYC
jgi:hypothetical protein